jgi:predicted phosphodiesterase
MKIISYSDLHLEFGSSFMPPADTDADVMILAGDIITCKDYKFLQYGTASSLCGHDTGTGFIAGYKPESAF